MESADQRVLRSSALVLLNDLRSTLDPNISVELGPDYEEDTITIWRWPSRGVEQQINAIVDPNDRVRTTVDIARQVLDSDLFFDWYEAWPLCPLHPGAGHSLEPVAHRRAMWR